MTQDDMQRRISRLESRVKQGRVMLALLGALLASVVLVAQADPEPKPLVGSSSRLVDKKGQTRFEVQFEREGAPTAPPTLRLVDAHGRTWLSADLNAGRAHLKLRAVQDGAGALLEVSETDDRDHVAVHATNNPASVELVNAMAPSLLLKVVRKGPAGITLADAKGNERLVQSVDVKGQPSIGLLDDAGKLTWAIPK